jgi:hypothetical protein
MPIKFCKDCSKATVLHIKAKAMKFLKEKDWSVYISQFIYVLGLSFGD